MYMLNKHGWGLKEMLVLSGVLLLFLVIAIYYIYTMYQDLDFPVTVNYYEQLEERLEDNARVYLSDYYDGVLTSDGMVISRSDLRAYDLDVLLEDPNGHACSGYVLASKTHGEEIIDVYISCNDYTTAGFEDERIS